MVHRRTQNAILSVEGLSPKERALPTALFSLRNETIFLQEKNVFLTSKTLTTVLDMVECHSAILDSVLDQLSSIACVHFQWSNSMQVFAVHSSPLMELI